MSGHVGFALAPPHFGYARYFLPSLSGLWHYQAGHPDTRERFSDGHDDWLAIDTAVAIASQRQRADSVEMIARGVRELVLPYGGRDEADGGMQGMGRQPLRGDGGHLRR